MRKWMQTAGMLLLLLTLTACSPFRKNIFEVQPLEKCLQVANQFHESGFYHIKGRADYAVGADLDILDSAMEYEIWYSEGDCLLLCTYPGSGGIFGEVIQNGQMYVSDRVDDLSSVEEMRWKPVSYFAQPDVWLHQYSWEDLEKSEEVAIRPSAFGWRLSLDVRIPSYAGQIPSEVQDRDDYTVYFYLNGSGKFEKLVTSSPVGWIDTITIEKTDQEQIAERIDKEYKRASAQEMLSTQKDQLIDMDKFDFFSEILSGEEAQKVTTACKALLQAFQESGSYHIRINQNNTGGKTNAVTYIEQWKSGENWMYIARIPQDGILDGLPAMDSVFATLCWNGEYFSNPGVGTDREGNILWSPSEGETEYPPKIYTLDMDLTHAAYAAGSLEYGRFGVMFRGETPEAWGEGYGKEYALGFYFMESGAFGCLTLKTTGDNGSEQTIEILSTDPERVSSQMEAEYQKAVDLQKNMSP